MSFNLQRGSLVLDEEYPTLWLASQAVRGYLTSPTFDLTSLWHGPAASFRTARIVKQGFGSGKSRIVPVFPSGLTDFPHFPNPQTASAVRKFHRRASLERPGLKGLVRLAFPVTPTFPYRPAARLPGRTARPYPRFPGHQHFRTAPRCNLMLTIASTQSCAFTVSRLARPMGDGEAPSQRRARGPSRRRIGLVRRQLKHMTCQRPDPRTKRGDHLVVYTCMVSMSIPKAAGFSNRISSCGA